MKTLHLVIAAVAIVGQALPAHAQTGNRDVRCLMLSNLFAKTAPVAQAKEAAAQSRIFYLGRVSSKFTSTQLQAALGMEAKTIDSGRAGADMDKCLASVQAAAAAADAAGRKVAQTAGAGPAKP